VISILVNVGTDSCPMMPVKIHVPSFQGRMFYSSKIGLQQNMVGPRLMSDEMVSSFK
jgi:hypothetical protein